jgi:glutamate-1-semialdehyde 2,1-aminomutase
MVTDDPMNPINLIERANKVFPEGGLGNFDPNLFILEGNGSRVWDQDGKEYIDYLIGSGPMILGHSHPEVIEAVKEQLGKGTTFFTNNQRSVELAEIICQAVPCADQIRFLTTGSEADMYAIRLARAFTGRNKIMKFEGGYHGMSAEAQMSLAPKKLANFPIAVADSAGIPDCVSDEVLVAPFNDIQFVRSLIAEYNSEIAAVIVEPFQRIIPPISGFLEVIREECTKNGIVLVFDEIVTGFRFAYGGAQEYYGVIPDICTLGKIIGGGFPLSAIAGQKDIMAHFDKSKVSQDKFLMQNGTLNGNPLAAVSGLKTLEILKRPSSYELLWTLGEKLMTAISDNLNRAGHKHQIVGEPPLFDVVFKGGSVNNYRDFIAGNEKKSETFNALLRLQGILKSPNKLYVSLALSDDDIGQTLEAISHAANSLDEFYNVKH